MLQILISTMNCENPRKLLKKMNVKSDAIIINQGQRDSEELMKYQSKTVKLINSSDRGLSKSRNKAIYNAFEHEFALIADDDLIYVDSYEKIISEEFIKHKNYDILVFQVVGLNKKFKKYSLKEKDINRISALKISSVQIALKVNEVKNKNLKFDEDFGSGSIFKMGEENIFINNCLKNGMRIRYIPIKIADLFIGDSSWFKGFNDKYFFDRGAIFKKLFPNIYMIFILQFAIRHYKKYKNDNNFFNALNNMLKGAKEIKKNE